MAEKQGKYTFVDLFAGCGGLSEGFLQTGRYESLAHVEWEKPMVDTLRHRLQKKWGHTEAEARRDAILFDIQRTQELIKGGWSEDSLSLYGTDNSSLVQKHGLEGIVGKRHVNLIIGGPPCQAYSIHGRATDRNSMRDDYRNYLFESFCKVVEYFSPDMFLFENVAGLLSAKPGGTPVTERIYKAFADIGYEIRRPQELRSALFNAADFNVPQYRPRVIILGVRKGGGIHLDDLYAAISSEKAKGDTRTVRDAIGFLPALYPLPCSIKEERHNRSHHLNPQQEITHHEARYHNTRDRGIYREWIERKMNNISHKEMLDYYRRVTGHTTLFQKYKSLEWDKPSHTVVAHLSKDGNMFIHPDSSQERSITVREAACLQSFPLDYDFLGSTPYNYRMIGNAVPPTFAYAIATGVYKVLDKILS